MNVAKDTTDSPPPSVTAAAAVVVVCCRRRVPLPGTSKCFRDGTVDVVFHREPA